MMVFVMMEMRFDVMFYDGDVFLYVISFRLYEYGEDVIRVMWYCIYGDFRCVKGVLMVILNEYCLLNVIGL